MNQVFSKSLPTIMIGIARRKKIYKEFEIDGEVFPDFGGFNISEAATRLNPR